MKDHSQDVFVRDEFITLGQLLKAVGAIGSGGEARAYLAEKPVQVNGAPDNRRGRKLRPGDTVLLEEIGEVRVLAENAGKAEES
jgi:ribosome-associated protein YbcJ (S4-like RNA binding protein)